MKNIFFLTATWLILLIMPAWAATGSIGQEKVKVRKYPSLKAEVLYQAHLGYPVQVVGAKGDWVQIKDWQDKVGWVYASLVNKKVHTAVIVPDLVNIRKGPGRNQPVVAQVKCGEVFKIFQEQKEWVKIGYYVENQVLGWIHKDLVWGE
jgi:SH3-like domain-containing protein